jgi:hypothetical protein
MFPNQPLRSQPEENSVKLRFQSNSIRFRLKRAEVDQLAKSHRVEESIVMGQGPDDTFQYVLEASRGVDVPLVHLKARGLIVQVPVETVRDWAESSEIGIEAHARTKGDQTLHVLIEKDFACLHGPSEDNVDTFPHPLAETGVDS